MSGLGSNPGRPKLRINLTGGLKVAATDDASSTITSSLPVETPVSMTPPAVTPLATPSGNKIRLKLGPSKPSTPVDGAAPPTVAPPAPNPTPPTATKTKVGRTSKPTAKKRAKDEAEISDDGQLSGSQPKKKIKIKPGSAAASAMPLPKITLLHGAGRPPPHPPGDGYNSEQEDAEEDPVIEEQIVFRMMEGEHLEYLRKQVDERRIGAGAEFKLRWLDDRRGYVQIQGQMYATVLVDLPTITEGMKSWDRKALVKSADICQMLLAFAKVRSEAEAKSIELPKVILDGYRWPHGLTPPMHDALHRRFRKRLSHKDILNKEAEVERLLESDRKAQKVKWEWVDEIRPTATAWTPESQTQEVYSGEEDAEGEVDDSGYFPADANGYHEAEIDDLEAELAAEMDAAVNDTPAPVEATPMTAHTGTPAAMSDGAAENDDDDDDSDGDIDQDDKERRNQEISIRQEVAELDKDMRKLEASLNSQKNAILQKRIQNKIVSLKEQKRLKLASVGLDVEDD